MVDGTLAMGIGFGTASMLSIGPNNLMMLREGLVRGRTLTIATIVFSSYAALLLSALLVSDAPQWFGPGARTFLSWCGLAVLIWFAVCAFRTARRTVAVLPDGKTGPAGTSARRALTVVWCNPLTYLELLLVPAACCAPLSHTERAEFIGVVIAMNALTCYGYALGGAVFGRLAGDGRVIRAFDLASGFLLAGSAAVLTAVLTVGS